MIAKSVSVARPRRVGPNEKGRAMSTKIGYLTDTWNPIAMRCDRMSPGCAHCWHLPMCKRHAANPKLPEALRIARGGGPFALMEDVLRQPLHWEKPRTVGVQFMGDWLHEKVKPEWIDRMLEVMGACPQHRFLTLTKRIENYDEKVYGVTPECPVRELGGGDYVPNIWLGGTCENQEWADKRIPILLQIPAAVRFVSLEPLLGPVNLEASLDEAVRRRSTDEILRESFRFRLFPKGQKWELDWCIVGCESGPKRRPCETSWVRSIVRQCHEAQVPVFVKQVNYFGEVIHDLDLIASILDSSPGSLRQMPTTGGPTT